MNKQAITRTSKELEAMKHQPIGIETSAQRTASAQSEAEAKQVQASKDKAQATTPKRKRKRSAVAISRDKVRKAEQAYKAELAKLKRLELENNPQIKAVKEDIKTAKALIKIAREATKDETLSELDNARAKVVLAGYKHELAKLEKQLAVYLNSKPVTEIDNKLSLTNTDKLSVK